MAVFMCVRFYLDEYMCGGSYFCGGRTADAMMSWVRLAKKKSHMW